MMDIDDKREWVANYYENDLPSDCVYIDDADNIMENVYRFVEDMDDTEVEEKYEKFKGTKAGAKVFEYWIDIARRSDVTYATN